MRSMVERAQKDANGVLCIDCKALTRPQIDRYLQELPTAHIKKLKLENFDVHKAECFLDIPENYIFQVFRAIKRNVHIESLELGNEFVKRFHLFNPRSPRTMILDIGGLAGMKSLIKLTLHNEGWDNQFFKGLQRYLFNTRVLQTLVLKNDFSEHELERLKISFYCSHSLSHYEGPRQEVLKKVLAMKIESVPDNSFLLRSRL